MRFRVMITDDVHADFSVDANIDVVEGSALLHLFADMVAALESDPTHDPMVMVIAPLSDQPRQERL